MGVSGRNQTVDLRIWRPNALPNSLITKINFMYSTTKLKICHLFYSISFQVAFDIANRIGILDVCQRLLHSVQSSLWLSDRASEREIPRSGVQILAMDSGIFPFPTLFTNQIIS